MLCTLTNTAEQRDQQGGEIGTAEVVSEVGPEMENKEVALDVAAEKRRIVIVVGVVDNEAQESFEIVAVFEVRSDTDETELVETE